MRQEVQIVTVGANEDGQRIDNFLLGRLGGMPKSHVYKLLRSGQVRVNGGRSKPTRRLCDGDKVRIPPVHLPEPNTLGRPPDALVNRVLDRIVFESQDYLAIDKPEGIAAHGGTGVTFGLIELLRAARPDDTGLSLCHRLDRDTSGLILLARNRPALLRVNTGLRDRDARKEYVALLVGDLAQGVSVDAALATAPGQGGERRSALLAEGREARSDFSVEQRLGLATLVGVRIHSGRMHQIRAHAASLGHPVVGDDKYGDHLQNRQFQRLGLKRMYLHAHRLVLPAVDGFGALDLTATMPADFTAAMQRIQASTEQ